MLKKRVNRVNRVCRLNRVSGGGGAASLADRIAALLGSTLVEVWLPTTAGLDYYFSDAAKTTPCADNDPCRVWAGATGALDLTQATLGNRPLARLVGGVWRLQFDGVDDILAAAYSQAAVGHAVAGVASLSDPGGYPTLIQSASGPFRELRGESSTRRMEILIDNGGAAATEAGALTLGTAYRLIASYGDTGGPSTLYRDGVAVATAAADSTTATPNQVLIGGRVATVIPWPGDVFIIVMCNASLSPGTVTDLDALLAEVAT